MPERFGANYVRVYNSYIAGTGGSSAALHTQQKDNMEEDIVLQSVLYDMY